MFLLVGANISVLYYDIVNLILTNYEKLLFDC